MRTPSKVFLLLLEFASIGACVCAQSLPDVFWQGFVSTSTSANPHDFIPITGAGAPSIVSTGTYGETASASADLSLSGPSLGVKGGFTAVAGDDAPSFNALADLTFSFLVEGPSSGVTIDLSAHASLSAQGSTDVALTKTDFSLTEGKLEVLPDDQHVIFIFGEDLSDNSSGITGSVASGFSGDFTEGGVFQLETNTVYSISAQVQALATSAASTTSGATFSSSASINGLDLAIDPSQADAGAYSIALSDGIAAVPEPASKATVVAAVAGLIALALSPLRRRA